MNNEENELLKLYEQQYTGRLFEKAVSYLNERNALFDERDELNKEIERLNNIINELERQSRLGVLENEKSNNEYAKGLATAYDYIYRLIRELKGE